MSRYPTKTEIEKLAAHLGTEDPSPFFDRVSRDVVWDVMGTHPLAGHFTTLASWKKDAAAGIANVLDGPVLMKVKNVCGGGDQEWALVELEVDAVCKNGMEYPQRYAWVMRFDENGIIVQVRAYLDSALVQKAVDSNS